MAGTRSMGASLTLVKAGSEASDLIIKNLTSIGAIEGENEEIDVTTLDSEGGAKEYMAGGTDYGSVECSMNVVGMDDPSFPNRGNTDQVEALQALFASREVRTWKRTDATGTITFRGYLSNIADGEETVDGLVTKNFTIRVSGKPTYSAGGES